MKAQAAEELKAIMEEQADLSEQEPIYGYGHNGTMIPLSGGYSPVTLGENQVFDWSDCGWDGSGSSGIVCCEWDAEASFKRLDVQTNIAGFGSAWATGKVGKYFSVIGPPGESQMANIRITGHYDGEMYSLSPLGVGISDVEIELVILNVMSGGKEKGEILRETCPVILGCGSHIADFNVVEDVLLMAGVDYCAYLRCRCDSVVVDGKANSDFHNPDSYDYVDYDYIAIEFGYEPPTVGIDIIGTIDKEKVIRAYYYRHFSILRGILPRYFRWMW